MAILTKYFPILAVFNRYEKADFRGDLNAGLTVGVMLIPQGMAYAMLAGMPPVYGLYAALVPLFIYGFMGTSRQLAVGPVAMISLLVIAGVGAFAEPGSDKFIQLAFLTAFGVGLTQFLLGAFRMGFLVNFLSHPVLSGFTSAAAIIIGASQIGSLLGISLPKTSFVPEILYHFTQQIAQINPVTAFIGIGSIIIMQVLRSWKRAFPSALAVVVIGTIFTVVFGLHEKGLRIVGDIPTGLPSFGLDWFNTSELTALIPLILVISLVGYMESIAVAKAIASKVGYRVDPNQELIALGTANIGGSFFQAFPTTGGLSRTAVNYQAGARTGVASIISAVVIGLTLLFLTPLFYYLPSAVLAAIIMVAVTSLFDFKAMKHLWKTDRRDLALFGITFLATLGLGIEEGIAVGVVVTLVMVIYQSSVPHSAELGRLGDSRTYRNLSRYPNAIQFDDILIFRFDSQLYFANTDYFRDAIEASLLKRTQPVNFIILDASAITGIDSTGMHTLEKMIEDYSKKGVQILIASAIGPVRDTLKRCGLMQVIGEDNFYFDIDHAVRAIQDESVAGVHYEVTQTNL